MRLTILSVKQPIPALLAGVILFCCTVSGAFAQAPHEPGVITYASSGWVPFCYQDEQGRAKGLYADILKEIFEVEMGLTLNFQELPWKRVQAYVENGEADFMVTVATENRLEYALKNEVPVLRLYLYVYTYKGHPRLNEIHTISSGMDIKRLGLTPVTNLGNNWHKINIDDYGVNTHYVPKEENAFQLLAGKRADITIEPLYAGSHLIRELGLADKVMPTHARFGPIIFHLLLSKKSPYAEKMADINQAFERVRVSGRYQDILDRYEKTGE